jgi:molybdate-binding protein
VSQVRQGPVLSAVELEFISKHPGGFDRAFFERTLPAMGAAFAQARGGDMIVLVHTASSGSIAVVRARVSLTWAEFATEDGNVEYVPFREIVRISVAARPPEQRRRRPAGFTAESLDDNQAPSPPSATES